MCVLVCAVESEDGAVVCEPGCLVLESDFLLSGELEFGDSEIMGLDREAGETHRGRCCSQAAVKPALSVWFAVGVSTCAAVAHAVTREQKLRHLSSSVRPQV